MSGSVEPIRDAVSVPDTVRMQRGIGWRFGACVVGCVCLTVLGHLAVNAFKSRAPWTNNDTAFIVYVAQQMDAGSRLYVDWHDTDPPSIFVTALAAVRLGRLGQIPSLLAYDLITVVVAILGVIVLVRSIDGLGRPRSAVLLSAAAYLFFLMKPGPITRDFGQREHLFALVLIPELFASACPRRMRWQPAWAALVAFMAMMKPQFLATLAVVELTAPRALRWRGVVLAGFVIGALAPLAMLWWHSFESLTALFTDALGVHLSGAYGFLDESPRMLLKRGPVLVAAAAVATLAAMTIVQRRDRTLRPLVVRATLGLACCALAVLQQRKFFPYHFVPLFGLAVVCGGWAAGEWLARSRQLIVLATAALVLAVGLTVFHADVSAQSDDPVPVRLSRVTHDDVSLLVESVYLHGLCTPFRGAPRCIGPEANTVTLPQMAWAADHDQRLRTWASTVQKRVRESHPDLIALSTGSLAMPDGLSPATLLRERFDIFQAGDYVELSPTAEEFVRARNWLVLRRRDVPEHVTAP